MQADKVLRINLLLEVIQQQLLLLVDASSVVVVPGSQGSSLYMYGEEKPKTTGEQKQQSKLPLPEIKWEHHKVHDKRAIITLVGTKGNLCAADGVQLLHHAQKVLLNSPTFSWHVYTRHGKSGKGLGNRVLEGWFGEGDLRCRVLSLYDCVKYEVCDRCVLNPTPPPLALFASVITSFQSAVTWLCFSPNSEEIITASKDGSIRIWKINENKELVVLATASTDKKVKLWASPPLHPS
ncbi:UNVERIFIED_CONTAM: hypothetical protein Sangu_0030400 [Sesamum angustifolium]|uniref:Uncharacterized protein n=1 Tax=Sesamum angustifolium TaxID=2727405 RepID=A0AAW2RJF8_9LAMI